MGISMETKESATSNPLPPPPRPGRRSAIDDEDAEQKEAAVTRLENLSNADFRRMVMETPRRNDEKASKDRPRSRAKRTDEDEADGEKRKPRRHWNKMKEEEKQEDADLHRYRDRAKERREDQNPDYSHTAAELGSLHAVAPPGSVSLRTTDAHKISIENSKFLGGDVEHTHLVKGLDYALLHKVRSEIDHKPEEEEEEQRRGHYKEEQAVTFRMSIAKTIYQWIVKPQLGAKANEMFLPGRMAFVFTMDEEVPHDLPTTVYRSKADCPGAQETVTVGVDGTVLERIAKIMAYLRLGSSGKVLKKKKKEGKGVSATDDQRKVSQVIQGVSGKLQDPERLMPPPPAVAQAGEEGRTSRQSHLGNKSSEQQDPGNDANSQRKDEDDIFQGAGVNLVVNGKTGSPAASEDMEESPRDNEKQQSYFATPVFGTALHPPPAGTDWQQQGFGAVQGPTFPGYQRDWNEYASVQPEFAGPWAPTDQFGYGDQQFVQGGDASLPAFRDSRTMTQDEKDRGLGSVFKRDDQRLQQCREKDAREKDPNFISESYSECYPGYQEYNREVVDSDEEEDLTKMDMGGRAKGRRHRWDFETEEEWASYNEQKEAMPKAAFQFGVKMQDGRKTRKQNKDQKLTNELHKINQILDRKKKDKGGSDYPDGGGHEEEVHDRKRLRM